MGTWLDLPQIWSNTTAQKTEYINYDSFYYNYNDYILEDKDVQYFTNGLFYPTISTAEASGLFNCFNPIEITTPIKRRGAKMG